MNKQRIIIIGLLLIAICLIVIIARWYPVAIVNGSPVWYHTWHRYMQGMNHALALEKRLAGLSLDAHASVVPLLKKNALNTLIEDAILVDGAQKLFPEFNSMSEERISRAIASSTDIGKAAQLMYGFDGSDFHDFILLPQSHREVMEETLQIKNINFPAWLAGIKKKARVTIFLYPYSWDGENVK